MPSGGKQAIRNKVDLNCPEAVRRWYRSIGSKGGQAGKGSEARREVGRASAKKRWAKIRASGGVNWAKPKGRPKKKRPQAKPPKRKEKVEAGREGAMKRKLAAERPQPAGPEPQLPVIGFK